MTTATQIREAREAKHWTQEHLAVYADVAGKTVWKAEQEGQVVSPKVLRRIGSVLEIDLLAEVAS